MLNRAGRAGHFQLLYIFRQLFTKMFQRMKKILLLSTLALAGLVGWAQPPSCEPDPSAPLDEPIYPPPYVADNPLPCSGISDTAVIGEYFEFVQTVTVPENFEGVPLLNIIIPDNAVSNLPTGIDYVCNPPDCIFDVNTQGCIVLYGTPEVSEPDVFDLEISVVITLPGPTPFPYQFPNDQVPGNFFLHVQESCADDCTCDLTSSTYELGQDISFLAQPNPSNGYTLLQVESQVSGEYQLILSDLLGRLLVQREVQLIEGANTLELDASHLSAGMYQVSLSNGRSAVTQKLIIAKR